jgi:hypothetical protein
MALKDRIGEYLVIEGKITEKQLATALERQLVMGGRLGTNLIELGLITEEELVDLLSKKFNVPAASIQELDRIEPSLIKMISRDLAQKYSVVPFSLDRKTLSVVLLNPQNLDAVSELGFITGCVIKPHVSSEARILYALEQYYNISRPLRYISLLDEERKRHQNEEKTDAQRKEPTREELNDALNEAKEDWGTTRNRDEAIYTYLKSAHIAFGRGILFLVKSGKLFGWRSFPLAREVEVKKLQINLPDLAPFQEVAANRSHYQGPPPEGPVFGVLVTALGGDMPKQIMLAPIIIKGTVVAILYVDHTVSELPAHSIEFILTASQKLSLALEILILKNKILEV